MEATGAGFRKVRRAGGAGGARRKRRRAVGALRPSPTRDPRAARACHPGRARSQSRAATPSRSHVALQGWGPTAAGVEWFGARGRGPAETRQRWAP